jgi:hypothetical protein
VQSDSAGLPKGRQVRKEEEENKKEQQFAWQDTKQRKLRRKESQKYFLFLFFEYFGNYFAFLNFINKEI